MQDDEVTITTSTTECTTNNSVNWNVRVKSKEFWLGIVGAIGVAVMSIANALGLNIDVEPWMGVANTLVTTIFTVLALIGVITDPTTQGIADSIEAMSYTEPKKKQTQCTTTTTSETITVE